MTIYTEGKNPPLTPHRPSLLLTISNGRRDSEQVISYQTAEERSLLSRRSSLRSLCSHRYSPIPLLTFLCLGCDCGRCERLWDGVGSSTHIAPIIGADGQAALSGAARCTIILHVGKKPLSLHIS